MAHFRIRFEITPSSPNIEFPMEFGKGELIAMPVSKPGAFVAALCRALEAKPCPASPARRLQRLEFAMALGRNVSRARGGGRIIGGSFGSTNGPSIATKLFPGGDDDEAEVYLNLNPTEG